MNAEESLEKAKKNFILVHNSGKNKYKYLPSWVFRKSNYLLNEVRNIKTNSKIYKQGAIVKVDFGVNVGSELSGNHFAVVLNKKDNYGNKKLTVIPLSSKDFQTSIELDDLISDYTMEKFKKFLEEKTIVLICFYILNIELYKTLGLPENEQLKSPDFAYLIEKTEAKIGKITPDIAISTIKKLLPKWDLTIEGLVEQSKKSGEELKLMTSCVKEYEKYKKKSYAKISDITTISKTRLKRINRMDPIGEIRVSKESMLKINAAIKEQFFVDSID